MKIHFWLHEAAVLDPVDVVQLFVELVDVFVSGDGWLNGGPKLRIALFTYNRFAIAF